MDKFECTACGFVFDVKIENPEFGLEPPYDFENLTEDWVCPICGASKSEFRVCEE